MSDVFRSENETAAEHVRAILRENESLRRDIAALRAAAPYGSQPERSRVGVFVAGAVVGLAVGAGLVTSMMLTTRCRVSSTQAVAAPAPMVPTPPIAPAEPPVPAPVPTPAVAPTPPPAAPAADEQAPRAQALVRAFAGSGGARRCWEQALRRTPTHAAESVRVSLALDANGHVALAAVTGSSDPELARCIEARARTISLPPGPPTEVETTFRFTPAD